MTARPLYCVPRLPNAGLGNRLLPWARCAVFARLHGAARLAPVWWNIKVGPILRREADWRWYVGQFVPAADELTGWARWRRLRSEPRYPEPADLTARPPSGGLVEFTGLADYFGRLNDHHAQLKADLLAAVAPRWRGHGPAPPPAPIALHIRRGDFKAVQSVRELETVGNARTPLEWFVEALRRVREAAGAEVPAYVLSDGTDDDLRDLLALPAVTRAATGAAIGDLLALSHARLLLGSGGSTFSVWGALLAQCPAVFPAGDWMGWMNFRNAGGRYVGVFDPWRPDPAVTRELAAAAGG